MDFNSIFNAFEQPEDNQKIDEVNLLMDFSEHPLYWIGGFNKIISNHLFFKTYTVKIFKENLVNLFRAIGINNDGLIDDYSKISL